MKRRICKKLHLRDYAEYGSLIKLNIPHDNPDELLDNFQSVVEKYGLSAWGGGNGYILTPKVSANYIIPTVIEQLVIGLMSVEDDGCMVFVVNSHKKNVCQTSFLDDIKTKFNEVKYGLEVYPKVDLWKSSK